MKKSIRPLNMNVDVHFEDIPKCPICNSKISPIYLSSKKHLDGKAFSLYCECPSCEKPFIAFYDDLKNAASSNSSISNYVVNNVKYLAPILPDSRTFDDKILKLSPNFVETYNQSLSAETYNLDQIAGMGYRKALEFLVKDFCIYKNPNKESNILNMMLGNCINTYIEDTKIKNLTKVSAWLGNDETHYIKKFEDKDINDLKRFIDTALYFILYNLNADEAEDIINSQ